MLEKERDGFPGHLDEIGYHFNLPCWTLKSMADGGFEQWWPYEQTGYWMDAMTRTALLLRDGDMLARASRRYRYVDRAGGGRLYRPERAA